MMKSRFTKSLIENEEGLNHLWIQLDPLGQVEYVRIQIILSAGLYRIHNLSGYIETDAEEIEILNPMISNNIVVEIFTRTPILTGVRAVIIAITYKEEGKHTRIEQNIPLTVVGEEEIGGLIVDEEAANFVKEHIKKQHSEESQDFIDFSHTKVIRIEANKYSELEKKYRIEGT